VTLPGTSSGAKDVPALHLITDEAVLASPGFSSMARDLLESGGPRIALHVRGASVGGGALCRLATGLVPIASGSGSWLVVNDRVDVAMAAGVRRVQLGTRSIPLPLARTLLGSGARLGASTHSPAEADRAARWGADWIFAGTTFDTPSHPGREGGGVGWLGEVVRAARGTPVLAIGGVTPRRISEIRAVGARGAAVIRGVWNASRPVTAMNEYLEALAGEAGLESGGR
jgi:thiamine-phosphate diphosphorylase